MKPHECPECGQPVRRAKRQASFCSIEHKRTFNNRRAVRGAMLYDVIMGAHESELKHKTTGFWILRPEEIVALRTRATALIEAWQKEDAAAGRRSVVSAKEILWARPAILA